MWEGLILNYTLRVDVLSFRRHEILFKTIVRCLGPGQGEHWFFPFLTTIVASLQRRKPTIALKSEFQSCWRSLDKAYVTIFVEPWPKNSSRDASGFPLFFG
jgi:hypothetical protein